MIWLETQALFYGSVGCEIRHDSMFEFVKWRSFIIILVGVATRFVVTFLTTLIDYKNWNLKERLYISLAWIPKAGG